MTTTAMVILLGLVIFYYRQASTYRAEAARLRARRSRTARTLWNLRRRANDMEAAFLEVCIERHALLREVEGKRARLHHRSLN